jgi:hypothetical protein
MNFLPLLYKKHRLRRFCDNIFHTFEVRPICKTQESAVGLHHSREKIPKKNTEEAKIEKKCRSRAAKSIPR